MSEEEVKPTEPQIKDVYEFVSHEQKYGKKKVKPEIVVPQLGVLATEFIEKLIKEFKGNKKVFFKQDTGEVVEIIEKEGNKEGEREIGFYPIRSTRFVTIIEDFIVPVCEYRTKYGTTTEPKSISVGLADIILQSKIFQDSLPQIKRIFPIPLYVIRDNKLKFPKQGYDFSLESWTPINYPKLDLSMDVEKAKEIINNVFKEFCFKSQQDKVNAIAGLLTPFVRGLYSSPNVRSPIFFYLGNRERVGKDYCANITGIVLEGISMEEPPISNGEARGNNNEELRKKLTSALIRGRRRLHFANNRGYIDNAVLESFATMSIWSDRLLGRNDISGLSNEIELSLSGNVGVTFTPDFANRCVFVNLFLDMENANEREFSNPNLHEWVKENRGLILSAIYSLIRNWFEKDMPKGSIPFASFPEWAKIVGGIMECAGYESPCNKDNDMLNVGGDTETKDMKTLFEVCANYQERYQVEYINKAKIQELIKEEEIFGYLDFDKKADDTKFGIKLSKFVNRILSNIKLVVENEEAKGNRRKYRFVNLVKDVNVSTLHVSEKNIHKSSTNDNKVNKVNKNLSKEEFFSYYTNLSYPKNVLEEVWEEYESSKNDEKSAKNTQKEGKINKKCLV